MDTFESRRESAIKTKSLPARFYKKPVKRIDRMRYSTQGESSILQKKWVPAKFLGNKVSYEQVVKKAKPNSNLPSFVRGNEEDVKITSFKLLKKFDQNKM